MQVGEGCLQQVGDVLLNVRLIVGWTGGAQSDADLSLLHQVEHVGQDAGVHGQPCRAHASASHPLCCPPTYKAEQVPAVCDVSVTTEKMCCRMSQK